MKRLWECKLFKPNPNAIGKLKLKRTLKFARLIWKKGSRTFTNPNPTRGMRKSLCFQTATLVTQIIIYLLDLIHDFHMICSCWNVIMVVDTTHPCKHTCAFLSWVAANAAAATCSTLSWIGWELFQAPLKRSRLVETMFVAPILQIRIPILRFEYDLHASCSIANPCSR
jgi:hypothetical protein